KRNSLQIAKNSLQIPEYQGIWQVQTGSTRTASTTTHSREPGDFPETSKRPALGGLRRRRFGLRGDLFRPGGDFGRVVSGRGNPVSRKRRPSSAETRFECRYCAIKPSI